MNEEKTTPLQENPSAEPADVMEMLKLIVTQCIQMVQAEEMVVFGTKEVADVLGCSIPTAREIMN